MFGECIKKHWAALLVALLVSLLYGVTHLVQIQAFGWAYYEPITVASDLDAAVTYFPRAKAVFEGDIIVGDSNLAEYAESPAWMPLLNPLVMGNFAKLFGSMKMGVVVSDFLFPPVIFLLFYWFIHLLTRRRFVSLVAASFFIFGPGLPFWRLSTFIPPIFSFPFGRIDWPKMTMPFYLLAGIFTYVALMRRRGLLIVLAGIFAGSLFYTDLFEWVTFYAGLGLLLLWFLFTRSYTRAKIVSFIIAIGLVVSLGYWMNFWNLTHLSQYQDIVTRVGVERSHGLRLFMWWVYARFGIAIALLYLLFLRKRKDDAFAHDRKMTTPTPSDCDGEKNIVAPFLIAFLLTIFATFNLQVITGVVPQPDHWVRPLFPYLYGTFAVIALEVYERYLKRIPFLWWNVGGVVVVVMLFSVEGYYLVTVGERGQMHDFFTGADAGRSQHRIFEANAASYRWMNVHLPPQAVVASLSPSTNLDLQLYTNKRLFLPYGLNTIAPNEEIWQRFFYLAGVYHLSSGHVNNLFGKDAEMILYLFQNAFYPDKLNDYFKQVSRIVPPPLLEEKRKRYEVAEANRPPFKLEYIYFGPHERALGAEDPQKQNSKLKKVYEDKQVSIYKL